ncbi:MAG: hypothetical protein IJ058_13870 [Lachnospiraceae bacterium]|nr:hypothetical protein [Lachnospiraceae bacterium]MBQ8947867.1 hypothetical protein [Lachnospiraceae bacterium]
MLSNFIAIILFIISSYLFGYALLTWSGVIDSEYRLIHYVSAPLGMSVYGVIAAFFYFRLEWSAGSIKIVWGVISLLSLLYILICNRKKLHSFFRDLNALWLLLALFIIMIMPGLYKGANYYAYKGNPYDKLAYVSEISYMVNHDVHYGDFDMTNEEYYPDVLYQGYYYIVNDRPLVSLICAVMATGGELFVLTHLYVSMIWAFISAPMTAMLEILFPGMKKWKYLVFSLIYTFCVYCQIQNDMDTWSQQCASSILISFTVLWLIKLNNILILDGKINVKDIILLGLTGTGAFMIYAENTWLHGLVLISVTIIMFLGYRSLQKCKELLKAVIIPFFMLTLCYISHPGTFKCAFGHILFATMSSNQNWSGFYNYWLGYHEFIASSEPGALIKKILTIIPGWSGMYMLTPIYSGIHRVIICLWLLAMAFLSIGVIGLVACSAYHAIHRKDDNNSFFRSAILFCSLLSICFFAVCIAGRKFFTGAKTLMFTSHFLYIMFAMPVMLLIMQTPQNAFGLNSTSYKYSLRHLPLMLVSGIFLICQISALGLRIGNIITDDYGIMQMGYYYPQMESDTKIDYILNFDERDYADQNVVALVGGSETFQKYVKLCLTYENVDYYTVYNWHNGKLSDDTELRSGDTAIYASNYLRLK